MRAKIGTLADLAAPLIQRHQARVVGQFFRYSFEDHLPGLPRATKLQLRVGQDDSSLTGNRLGALVNREAESPQLLRRLTTYDIHDMAEGRQYATPIRSGSISRSTRTK